MQREAGGFPATSVVRSDAAAEPLARLAQPVKAPPPELIQLATRHHPGPYERWVKPAIDLVGGLVLTVLSAPLLLFGIFSVWVRLGRPVIYRQERVGRGGQTFFVYKLRTMLPDRRTGIITYVGPERRVAHKRDDDPRHTGLGRFLRRFKIDELPQCWNVLRAEMSMVGPRPELKSVVQERYEVWQHLRHRVKPGLTGPWQISPHEDGLMYLDTTVDLEYIARLSAREDLRIMLATPATVLGLRRQD